MNFDYKELLDNLHEGVYIADRNRKIIYWNKAAESITGYSANDVVGFSCADNILVHIDSEGTNLCQAACPLLLSMNHECVQDKEVYLHHKDGHRVPVWVRACPLKNENQEIIGAIELFTDISSKEITTMRIKELEDLALLDPLTKLANRRYILEQLKARFSEMERYNMSFGIIFADIDNFKNFNDTYGHDIGDRVLKTIAKTFISSARPFDIFARWGGEEFIGIIKNVNLSNLVKAAERFRILVENSVVKIDDKLIHLTVSMGATICSPDDTIDSLIKRADTLMYRSKENGRNRLTVE